jgi:hypothetical protein
MALSEHYLDMDDLHPIDLVEYVAEHRDWQFDRIHDDQIALSVEAQWRTYAITLAWNASDETLRLICTYEMEPPPKRIPALYEALNTINDMCWAGSCSWWGDEQMMVYRYGLVLAGDQVPSAEQVDTMIGAAVASSERYYPAIQLVTWAERSPKEAVQIAISEAYGRA